MAQQRGDEENVSLVTEQHELSKTQQYLAMFPSLPTKTRKIVLVFSLVAVFLLLLASVRSSSTSASPPITEENDPNTSSEEFDIDALLEHKEDYAINCTAEEFSKLQVGSHEYKVKEADCGTGYRYLELKSKPPVHVVIYGEYFKDNFQLSGCPVGERKCPHHPRCVFSIATKTTDDTLPLADVVIVGNGDAGEISKAASKSKKSKVRKILYWREAYWPYVSPAQQRKDFDLGMGVHFMSGIVNPNYLRRPRTLVAKSFVEFLPFKDRDAFALSIISNCAANSERQRYIGHLSDYLGAERVHQYGDCGTRRLPPPPIKNAAKVISKYKFYLSFENTIQHGYVSEKLFTVLNMPLIPVYYGARNVPNITKIPSFIKAHDFKGPKALAEYLLYLDSNSEAYGNYHRWRMDASLFTDEYLDMIKRKFPSQGELKAFHGKGLIRNAECCRLCNLEHLDDEIARRTDADLVQGIMSSEQINKEFFGGKMYRRPGPNARLDRKSATAGDVGGSS